jgi:Spy/CpxP family protein refolding chaperone
MRNEGEGEADMKKYIALLGLTLALVAVGQQHQPYKGEDARKIKALSETDLDGLREGRGMGLAKAAELNRYPGPMHVLELKDELQLTPIQAKQTQSIMGAMRTKARKLGKQIIDHEAALDALFAQGTADAKKVGGLTRRIGSLHAELRLAHLEAHLAMKKIMSKKQIDTYSKHRGYSG